ncbi:MAG: hypothetical protein ACPL7D_13200 [Candidatus Sumerlaeaceae bacterium]
MSTLHTVIELAIIHSISPEIPANIGTRLRAVLNKITRRPLFHGVACFAQVRIAGKAQRLPLPWKPLVLAVSAPELATEILRLDAMATSRMTPELAPAGTAKEG